MANSDKFQLLLHIKSNKKAQNGKKEANSTGKIV